MNLNLPEVSHFIKGTDKYYKSFNPSLFQYKKRIYVIFRLAYGEINSFRKTYIGNTGGMINYPSKICLFDGIHILDLKIPNIKKIFPEFKNIKYRLCGYEDPRTVVINDTLYIFVCTFANNNKYVQIMMIIVDLFDLNNKSYKLITPSRNENMYQKNWMPFVYNEEIYLVYSSNPQKILKCNKNTGETIELYNHNYNISKNIRGGSNCLLYNSKKYGNCYLTICHIRRYMLYTHLFYIFESEPPFRIKAITDEFIIRDKQLYFTNFDLFKLAIWVQFASGIAIEGNTILVAYGESNVRSKIFHLENELLEVMLKNIL